MSFREDFTLESTKSKNCLPVCVFTSTSEESPSEKQIRNNLTLEHRTSPYNVCRVILMPISSSPNKCSDVIITDDIIPAEQMEISRNVAQKHDSFSSELSSSSSSWASSFTPHEIVIHEPPAHSSSLLSERESTTRTIKNKYQIDDNKNVTICRNVVNDYQLCDNLKPPERRICSNHCLTLECNCNSCHADNNNNNSNYNISNSYNNNKISELQHMLESENRNMQVTADINSKVDNGRVVSAIDSNKNNNNSVLYSKSLYNNVIEPEQTQTMLTEHNNYTQISCTNQIVVSSTETEQIAPESNNSVELCMLHKSRDDNFVIEATAEMKAKIRSLKEFPEPGHSMGNWVSITFEQQKYRRSKHTDSITNRSMPKFTHAEIMAHNKPNDMWIVIDDVVYDITKFASYHPGGGRMLRECAGKDATFLYYAFHPWVSCEAVLGKFVIGKV